ncbi:MAG: GNAT family N-acetyltransferase [Saprospiraceae bacterium]|nr:GNAT family N-acetyltransferase [Saprospiraceae bacterium]
MDIRYQLKRFSDLTSKELYSIFQLRQEVFIVEQNCPYVDADGLDQDSYHLSGYLQHDLVAYTRLIPPGIVYERHAAITRVINARHTRGKGVGKDLMKRSIELSRMLWPETSIKIGAQSYLKSFYEALGFIRSGDEYLEDGILHIHMILDYNS